MVQIRPMPVSTLSLQTYPRKVTQSLFIPITISWDEGSVVTETQTEYREVNNDGSDLSELNQGGASLALQKHRQDSAKLWGQKPKSELTSKAESESSSDDDDDDNKREKFEKEALKAHNECRAKHGVAPLKLDKEMCKFSKKWADKLAKEDQFKHNPDQTYGENIYCSWSSDMKAKCPGSRPVESWYSEVSKYNFDSPPENAAGAGHFTQVVWKESKKLGIAKARSATGKIIVVANYDPPGNFIGQYKNNVTRPAS